MPRAVTIEAWFVVGPDGDVIIGSAGCTREVAIMNHCREFLGEASWSTRRKRGYTVQKLRISPVRRKAKTR